MRSAPSEQCDNVSDRGVTGSQIKTEYALIAQSVEHAAVNRGVTGSSPVWGAKEESTPLGVLFPFTPKGFNLCHCVSVDASRLLTGSRTCARGAR